MGSVASEIGGCGAPQPPADPVPPPCGVRARPSCMADACRRPASPIGGAGGGRRRDLQVGGPADLPVTGDGRRVGTPEARQPSDRGPRPASPWAAGREPRAASRRGRRVGSCKDELANAGLNGSGRPSRFVTGTLDNLSPLAPLTSTRSTGVSTTPSSPRHRRAPARPRSAAGDLTVLCRPCETHPSRATGAGAKRPARDTPATARADRPPRPV